MKVFTLFILLVFNASYYGYSQEHSITGKVEDVNLASIEGATVVLRKADDAIVSFTTTNEEGKFQLRGTINQNYRLEISHLAYQNFIEIFETTDIVSPEIQVNATLQDRPQSLNEVLLISKNTEKDTVNFDLTKLNLQKQDNLREILEKIPNFKIDDNGTIIYKGKNIDKILVNKKSAFISQNSIALESIENEIVEGLSVINNYNDDFTLDFDEVEESVLNIDINKDFKNILNGSVEAKYGISDKYQLAGEGFLFSDLLNAFATTNTNNIGKTDLKLNELKNLFSERQPLSIYQIRTISNLFNSDDNLEKDFFSNSNITVRRQSERLKFSGLIYHFSTDRIKRTMEEIEEINGNKLLTGENRYSAHSNSIIGIGSVAYKISKRTIAHYEFRTNFLNSDNLKRNTNILFTQNSPSETNTVRSENDYNISSFHNQLGFTSKLRKRLIASITVFNYLENNDLLNGYSISSDSINDLGLQNYEYNKNVWNVQGELKFKGSEFFIPSVTISHSSDIETLNTRETENSSNDLDTQQSIFQLNIDGNDLFDKLDYNFSIGLAHRQISNSVLKEKISNYVPLNLSLGYENRLNRYTIDYSRSQNFSPLETGINTIQPFNTLIEGDSQLPFLPEQRNNIKASYSYNNIFDAKVFSTVIGYQHSKNTLRTGFLSQEGSVSKLQYFLDPDTDKFFLRSYYSQTLSQLSYPTKIDVTLGYESNNYSTSIASKLLDSKNTIWNPSFQLRTITDDLINFKVGASASFIKDNLDNSIYDSKNISGRIGMLLKNEKWSGNLLFISEYSTINNTNYSRQNINFDIAYFFKRITLSIESRHFGELISLWQNSTYNNTFNVGNGIATSIFNNKSLNYLIAGIKYKL